MLRVDDDGERHAWLAANAERGAAQAACRAELVAKRRAREIRERREARLLPFSDEV
ncbi:MAG: hypothetical protein JWL58_5451 [Streptosporangiaceae bacterium]|nr:hypothetical protein [Streptosporangiaceae bacterium]